MKIISKTLLLLFISININAQNYGEWKVIDSMNIRRTDHASTLMQDGNLMVAGGWEITNALSSCEIYDVTINKWQLTTPMHYNHTNASLVTLNDGRIFVIGGRTNKCEIFNPTTQSWKITDSLIIDRYDIFQNTVAKLDDGKILVTGGTQLFPTIRQFANCEIFDPLEERWAEIDSLHFRRWGHTTTALKNGKILVVGGLHYDKDLNICEMYDPEVGKWEIVDSLNVARSYHEALLLDDGKVFVTGGTNYDNPTSPGVTACEVYDPLLDKWEIVGHTALANFEHSAFFINQYEILLVGGGFNTDYYEIFDTKTNSSVFYGKYPVRKVAVVFGQISKNKVIRIGGLEVISETGLSPTNKCEMYDPMPTHVEENYENPPTDFVLYPNYPNPFNATTNIEFYLPERSDVRIKVYTITGEEVTDESLGEKSKGTHRYVWSSLDNKGSNINSGIYIYQIILKKKIVTRKMVYLK